MDGNELGERTATERQERRTQPRYPLDEELRLMLVNQEAPVQARIVDLSREGCSIRTRDRFTGKPGRSVEVSFKLRGFSFRFCGVVRWTDGQHLLGIRFQKMIDRRRADLIEALEELMAAQAQDLKPAVAESELVSGPRSGVPQRAVAPSSSQSLPAEKKISAASRLSADCTVRNRDRRGKSRHKVDSFCTIFLVRAGSALRGRILDLSLSGCRIHTDQRFPVGIYTRVEVEFHLQGLPFRLGGVVQAIHNRNTVGIRFLDVSERKRQQVQELIGAMEEIDREMPPDSA